MSGTWQEWLREDFLTHKAHGLTLGSAEKIHAGVWCCLASFL